jgi:G3E family GTPase
LQGLARGAAPARASAVVTVVDGQAGARQLDIHEEARDQVATADRILISKTDLASDAAAGDRLSELHRRLHQLNPEAERASFPPGEAGTAALVPWLLDPGPAARTRRVPRLATADAAAGAGGRDHRHQLSAASYVDAAPLLGEALLLVCEELGDRLVRAKGWVHLAGEPRRGFLERAGDRTSLELGPPWGADPPETRLVLIGEGLDEATLRPRLWACRAAAGAAARGTGGAV